MTDSYPDQIEDVSRLEELLSRPTRGVVESVGRLKGDVMLLGVGGKMGPTLARMVQRASDEAGVKRRVIGVARFSNPAHEAELNRHGVQTIRRDLLEPGALDDLPDAPHIILMTGVKFGTTDRPHLTWAVNCALPGMVCQRFRRSRIVAFSTGNVYGLTPASGGGSVETDELRPDGEYPWSAVGRERVLSHFAQSLDMPMAILRLNYAVEMRYGVLVDLARWVNEGRPIDLTMGYVNVIWQGEANAMSLMSFDHATAGPTVLNIAGPQVLRVREVCEEFGRLLGRTPVFTGVESADALLNNASRAAGLMGRPAVSAPRMMGWIADWLRRGGPLLDKPTQFERRDGSY